MLKVRSCFGHMCSSSTILVSHNNRNMGEFRLHHVRFFDYVPQAISCMAYDTESERLALARQDGSIEIWSARDNWFQEKVFPGGNDKSIEALLWHKSRLFSAGLGGYVNEHDLERRTLKSSVSSNAGAIWCMCKNSRKNMIAAGTEDGCLSLFDVREDDVIFHKCLDRQEGRLLCCVWYEPDDVIITGSVDNIRVWSSNSGHALQRLTLGRQDRAKETLVWSVDVSSDFTILSGDSRGKTIFWSGVNGTQLKAFQSHQADVLAVRFGEDGQSAFSSGIDPNVTQFASVTTHAHSDVRVWVRGVVRNQHTHDVRCLATGGKWLLSAGVDTRLVLNQLSGDGPRAWRSLSALPHTQPLVAVARTAACVLLRYAGHLELWRLGSTSAQSDKPNELLPLHTNPVKLLQLGCHGNAHVTCVAVTSCARWLAYSSTEAVRVFRLHLERTEIDAPKVEVAKVKLKGGAVEAANLLEFTVNNELLVVTHRRLQLFQLGEDDVGVLRHTFHLPESANLRSVHLLTSNRKYVVCADHDSNVHVFSLVKLKLVASLPKRESQPCALALHPTRPLVAVAYCDRQIVEYDIKEKGYSDWCKKASVSWPLQWRRRNHKVTRLRFLEKGEKLLVVDEHAVTIIDKEKAFPASNSLSFGKENSSKPTHNDAFHIFTKFKYVVELDLLDEDFAVLVERTPIAILESLPDAFKQKKFGT